MINQYLYDYIKSIPYEEFKQEILNKTFESKVLGKIKQTLK